jgi:glucan biosynthesis protein C
VAGLSRAPDPRRLFGTYFQFLPHYFSGIYGITEGGSFAVHGMHLWYVLYLLVFSLLLYPLLSWLRGRGQAVLAAVGGALGLPGVVYGLAVPLVLMGAFVDPESGVSFGDAGWPALLYLWLVFAGFLVVSHERLLASIRRLR